MSSASEGAGLLGGLRRLLTTALTVGQTRLQLLGNELQLEKHRALRLLAQTLALVFCLCMAVVLGVALLLTLWWEQRVLVLGLLLGLFLVVAVGLLLAMRSAQRVHEGLFSASLAELQEDLRQLQQAAQHAPQQDTR